MKDWIHTKHLISLQQVHHVHQHKRGLLFQVDDEKFRVDILRPGVLRLKISQGGHFDETPTEAVGLPSPDPVSFEWEETQEQVVLTTSKVRLVVSLFPFRLDMYRREGSVIFQSALGEHGLPIGYRYLNDRFVIERQCSAHDFLYGLGQKSGAFNRRGHRYILWNTDILAPEVHATNRLFESDSTCQGSDTTFDPYYISIPFFYHLDSSHPQSPMAGFFIDNGSKGHFNFQHPESYQYQFQGGQYTEYIFAGPSMPEILEDYTWVTGRMSAPPLWSLGHHHCRWHAYTQEKILETGQRYREKEIPCDVLWLDIDYMEDFQVFTWDSQKFPDVTKMLEQMKQHHFRCVTIIDPGVKRQPGYPLFDEGKHRHLFCKTQEGQLYEGQVWPGRTVFPDFVKPEARAWWAQHIATHVEPGIAGIWNDMNEPATGQIEPFAMRFDRDGINAPHERYHNQYALLMAMATHQGLKQAFPHLRPFILSRSGFSGIQRLAANWLGDNQSSWSHLAMGLSMASGLGISGQPFVGADIPGFEGTATPELMVRWMQYGALTPFCRAHHHKYYQEQYPWSFGPAVESLIKQALQFRYRLLPYLYTCFIEATETGAPVQRPLIFDFQNDPHTWWLEDSYLLGKALLVAPVLQEGQTSRHIYLPEGTWMDWPSKNLYQGPQLLSLPTPIHQIPLFFRGGYVVPLWPQSPSSTMGYFPETMDLHLCIPQEEGEWHSSLQEDDGVTLAYQENQAFLRTTFLLKREGNVVELTLQSQGKGFPSFRRKKFRLFFHHSTQISSLYRGQEELLLKKNTLELDHQTKPLRLVISLKE